MCLAKMSPLEHKILDLDTPQVCRYRGTYLPLCTHTSAMSEQLQLVPSTGCPRQRTRERPPIKHSSPPQALFTFAYLSLYLPLFCWFLFSFFFFLFSFKCTVSFLFYSVLLSTIGNLDIEFRKQIISPSQS